MLNLGIFIAANADETEYQMQLKEIRNSKGMTQEEVALALGIPKKTYQNYEREVREADSEILCKLADIYHVTVDELIGRESPEAEGEAELLKMFRKLNANGRARLLEIADDMVLSGKYQKREVSDRSVSSDTVAVA